MSSIKASLRAVSVLKDPFESSLVEKVFVLCHKSLFTDEWTYNGSIEFKNGETRGEQKFRGESMSEVIKKMEIFMETLDDK